MKNFVSHLYSCRSTCTWRLISLLADKGSSREDRECCAVLASVTAKYSVSHFYSCSLPFLVGMVVDFFSVSEREGHSGIVKLAHH